MIVELMIISIPFVFFSYQCLVGKAPLSSFMAGFYVYPLLILSSLTLEGLTIPGLQISESSANVVRLGIHGAVFIVLALVGLIFSHALFTTAFWTNLGDGSIILSMIFIVPMSAYGEYFKKGSSKATGHMASTVTIGKR